MKDPAFLFYTSDFLTSVTTMDMRERGQYITLLCLQHQLGHLTLKEIKKAVGKPSEDVLNKFEVDEDGKYFNSQIDEEKERRASHSKKQKENIQKRWNKNRTPGGNTTAYGNTTVLPLETETENETEILFTRELAKNLKLQVDEDRGSGGKEEKTNGRTDSKNSAGEWNLHYDVC